MSTKFKILSAISFIALAIVLTFVGVWSLTDLDFIVGGNITYTAPASEAKDVSEYQTLQFYVTDETAKTVLVQQNPDNQPTGELIIPSKVLSGGVEYTVTLIDVASDETLLQSTSQNFEKEITLPEMKAPDLGLEGAFFCCTSLTSIIIPESVISIGSYAFSNCTGLISITIPNSVTSIVSGAFYACEGLTEITIPESVISIGSYAFRGCNKLETVNIKATTVPTGGDAMFTGCTVLTAIYVPTASWSAYQSATYWSDYADYIKAGSF